MIKIKRNDLKKILVLVFFCSCSTVVHGFGSKESTQSGSSRGGFFGFGRSSNQETTEKKPGFFSRTFGRSSSQPQEPREKRTVFERLRGKPSPAELRRQEEAQRAQYQSFQQEERKREEKERIREAGRRAEAEKKIAAERESKAMLEKAKAEKVRQREALENEEQNLKKQIDQKQKELRKISEQMQSLESRFTSAFLERGATLQERKDREKAMKNALKTGDEESVLRKRKANIEKELRELENKKIEILNKIVSKYKKN